MPTMRASELRVIVLGGIDPSGGAGLSADVRVLQVHGAVALPVVTALTVQNRFGMRAIEPVRLESIRAALRAAVDDGPVHAVKTGLLASAEQVEAIASWLGEIRTRPPVVVDPVLSATAGGYTAGAAVATAYRDALARIAAVFTPNLPELAAVLAGAPVTTLIEEGCGAVLQKGGHGKGEELVDKLVLRGGELRFSHARRPVGAVHGTGCALASAIAAHLARGRNVGAACGDAIDWLQRCLGTLSPPARADAPPRPLPIVPWTAGS